MYRRLLYLCLSVTLLLGTVTYAAADTANTAAGASRALTLDEAINIALKSNTDLLRAGLSYDQAINSAKATRVSASDIKADTIDSLQSAQSKYVSTEQSKLAETVAGQAYEIAKKQTAIQVETDYYSALKAENLLKVNEVSVQRAKDQLSLVQKKFAAGTSAKTDVNRAEISLASAQADLINAQRSLKTAQVAFNQVLGVDVDETFTLTQVLEEEKVTVPDLAEVTKQAQENRLDIKKAENSVKIAQMNYDLGAAWLASNVSSVKNYKTQLESAKLDLLDVQQQVKADVISTIFNLEKTNEVVDLMSKNLDQAKQNYSLAQKRYQIGVGTYSDVLDASVDLANADANYIQAVYDNTIAGKRVGTVIYTAN